MRLVIPFSATPVFVGSPAPIVDFDITLGGNVTSSTFPSLLPGQVVIFTIRQGSAGNKTFAYPASAVNVGEVNPAPNSKSVQMCICDGVQLLAMGPIAWN